MRAKYELEGKYGSNYSGHPTGSVEWEAVWNAMTASEAARFKDYLAPLWRSARMVALASAPNFAAILVKIKISKEEELDNDGEMMRDPMDLIREDIRRVPRIGKV